MTPEERMLKQGQTWTHVDPSTRTTTRWSVTHWGNRTVTLRRLDLDDRLMQDARIVSVDRLVAPAWRLEAV